MVLGAVRQPFPFPTSAPVRACSHDHGECGGPRDSVSVSASALMAPQVVSTQALAALGVSTALQMTMAGGHSCFASCIECGTLVNWCVHDAGHSGRHRCPEGHGWW